MTSSKFANHVKFKSKIPEPKVLKYPLAHSSIPNVTICIMLCTVSLVIVLLFATSLLLSKSNKAIPVDEVTSSPIWQETTRPDEEKATSAIEEQTTRTIEEEVTHPIEGEATLPTVEKPEQQEKRYNFVSYTPSTILIGSHLWTVSRHHKLVNITSTDEKYSLCNLTLRESFDGNISSAALGNKIAIWSASARQTIGFFGRIKYTILLLDPIQCTYEKIQDMEDRLPIPRKEFPPVVLTYSDSLEIFFPSQTICFPCRFDANGNKIELENQVQTEAGAPILDYHLQTIEQSGKNRSYIYAVNYKNRSAVFKLLDQDFKVTKQMVLEHTVDSIAVGLGQNTSYIGVYYAEPDRRKFATYELLDLELDALFKSDVPLLKDHAAQKAFISIDSMGNSYVTVIEGLDLETERGIMLFRYNKSGRVFLEMSFSRLEDYQKYDIQAILFGDDTHYCLVVHEIYDNEPGKTDITCYNI